MGDLFPEKRYHWLSHAEEVECKIERNAHISDVVTKKTAKMLTKCKSIWSFGRKISNLSWHYHLMLTLAQNRDKVLNVGPAWGAFEKKTFISYADTVVAKVLLSQSHYPFHGDILLWICNQSNMNSWAILKDRTIGWVLIEACPIFLLSTPNGGGVEWEDNLVRVSLWLFPECRGNDARESVNGR